MTTLFLDNHIWIIGLAIFLNFVFAWYVRYFQVRKQSMKETESLTNKYIELLRMKRKAK